MSAVPKKKLCWNCEGNIAKEIDNCPYCGVYVHSPELGDGNGWNIPYITGNKKEEIPSPLYQIQEAEETETDEPSDKIEELSTAPTIFQQLKEDVLPVLLLMSGSIFFLFGIVLYLFSTNGTLTLQWNGNHWPYFLGLSLLFVYLGWKYLLQMDKDEEDIPNK